MKQNIRQFGGFPFFIIPFIVLAVKAAVIAARVGAAAARVAAVAARGVRVATTVARAVKAGARAGRTISRVGKLVKGASRVGKKGAQVVKRLGSKVKKVNKRKIAEEMKNELREELREQVSNMASRNNKKRKTTMGKNEDFLDKLHASIEDMLKRRPDPFRNIHSTGRKKPKKKIVIDMTRLPPGKPKPVSFVDRLHASIEERFYKKKKPKTKKMSIKSRTSTATQKNKNLNLLPAHQSKHVTFKKMKLPSTLTSRHPHPSSSLSRLVTPYSDAALRKKQQTQRRNREELLRRPVLLEQRFGTGLI